ncbi:MAG: DUF11 domain-containing protein [Gammaproteobacteria bacterium]|jgi:uncharacterized repeat protein (TIGR01451 family)|nr:MAG: DUF11 domain-containing protein [Gammaproteobacteria bacterium]
MSRHIPPSSIVGRWFADHLSVLLGPLVGLALTTAPMVALAEVTLNTTVERISTASGAPQAEAAGAPDSPSEVFSGDVLRYTIVFENTSTQDVAAGSVVITNPLPEQTVLLEGSAMGEDTLITYSVDGETFGAPGELLVGEGSQARAATASDYRVIRWAYQPILPSGTASQVSFELLIP